MAYQRHMDAVKEKIAGAAGDAADGAAKIASEVQTDSAALSRDIGGRAADLSGQVSDTVKELSADAVGLAATIGDAWDALEERFRALVRPRPLRAIVVSVAVGMVFGFVSRG